MKNLKKEEREWKPKKPKVKSGYLARYASMVTSGSKGAVLKIGCCE